MTQVLQQMWQNVGFTINLKTIEQAELISNAITGKFQAYTFEQFAAGDPDINYVWWSTTTVAPIGGIALNFARNSDPQIEAALQIGRSSSNQATRAKAYQRWASGWAWTCPISGWGDGLVGGRPTSGSRTSPIPKLPNGSPGKPFDNGVFFPTQIWMAG